MNYWDSIAAQTYPVCESSNIKATECGHIASLKAHQNLNNGAIVCRGDFVAEQVFKSKAYVAGSKPYLVLTPPIAYNTTLKSYSDEKYFFNAKDEIVRAYELVEDDIWTISEDAFSGDPEVGKFIDATYTVASQAGSTGLVGEIIEKVNYRNSVSYRIIVRSTGC